MLSASRKVSGRVLSTMTMKPSMPSERISHMKSNRFWPGVPKRYSTRLSSTVMRPKSMATVVFSFTRSSGLLILRSVETTSISLTVWMNSVLPALKGPVTTILTVSISLVLDRADAVHQAGDQGFLFRLFYAGERGLQAIQLSRGALGAHQANQAGLQ